MELDRNTARYAAFFCEENIWHLANELMQQNLIPAESLVLLFFSEQDHYIAVKNQRAFEAGTIGCWDYHAALLDPHNARVFDLDTRLDYPCPVIEYFRETFPDQSRLLAEYRTTVRSVPADEFITRFSSNRQHMLDADGNPLKEFPNWNTIVAENPIWLAQYLSVDVLQGSASQISDLDSFVASIAKDD